MARIGAALSGFELRLVNRLAEANAGVAISSLRLATGRQINAPADDPSGFVQIAGLESQRSTIAAALKNVTAASVVASKAQQTLEAIVEQLSTIQELVLEDEDQALSSGERAANQAAIDAALDELEALAGATAAGRGLFDGASDFAISGVDGSQVERLSVMALPGGGTRVIEAEVTTAATQALLTYTGAAGLTTAAATITVTGDAGSAEIAVNNAEALTEVRDRINLESHRTGVTATVSGDTLTFRSVEYGTAAKAQVEVESGTFVVTGGDASGADFGTNGVATINGRSVTGSGNRYTVNENGFSFTLETVGGVTGALDVISVAAGGARSFQLGVDGRRLTVLALPRLAPSAMGGLSGRLDELRTGGAAAGLGTNAPLAARIVAESLAQATALQGRVEGFADAAVASSASLLTAWEEDTSDAIDALDKVDQEAELVIQAKNQALAENALAGLAMLHTQRQEIVELVRRIAGLI